MPISTLSLTNLGPFHDVEFDFDPQVNVFVGPNNCGKSTALMAIADIVDDAFDLPRKLIRNKRSSFILSASTDGKRQVRLSDSFPFTSDKLGRWLSKEGSPWSKITQGLGYITFVPALRWSTDFRSEGPGRLARRERTELEEREVFNDWMRRGKPVEEAEDESSASLVRDAEVVQDIVELDYRAYRQKQPAMRSVIDQIASIASEITEGFPITFAGIAEDKRGLYPQFDTPDGTVPLDVLSQGTQSLIQWLARLFIGYARYYSFPATLIDKPGLLIVDEIDAHLHPSWQRRIIPAVRKEFPSLQIFCSTHSPLMLAGLKAGQIHLLRRDKKGKVGVSRNETDIIGWSADEIVTTFLGVENATDLQTEETIERLQELRGKNRLTTRQRKELASLRETVNQRLLGGPAVEQIDQLAERLTRSLGKAPARKRTKTSRTTGKPSAARRKRTISTSKRANK